MVHVRDEYPRFQQADGQAAVVVMAEPEQAAAFRSKYELPFPLLADPQRQAYQAFGLQRGSAWNIAGPVVWAAGLKSILRHGGGMPVGDPFQLGGAFVIDRKGMIRHARRATTSADHPPNAELIAALEELKT
ncbi:MAG: redoxin domain-containing protein [Planctomycetales bacterium]